LAHAIGAPNAWNRPVVLPARRISAWRPSSIEPIDPSAAEPPYVQILTRIERAISAGELVVGQLLPSERDLSALFRVSRPTLRRALDELSRAGRIVRLTNVGTFVADQRLRLGESLSFTDRVRHAGGTPSSRLLSSGLVGPSAAINQQLRLGPRDALIRLERVRLVDRHPIMVQISHLQARRFEGLLEEDLEAGSLYGLLRERFGVQIHSVEETVRACAIPPTVASVLECEPNSPGLEREFLAYDLRGEPVETCLAYVRGDVVSLRYTLSLGTAPTVDMFITAPLTNH
jgi:GntR family transcriptional regulator